MKITCTGHTGKIGRRLVALGVLPLECDITDDRDVLKTLQRVKPDVVIHCAAISSIEECEKDYEKAMLVNVMGTNIVGEQLYNTNPDAVFVLLSSEQVFNGKWFGRYKEESIQDPINNYGHTKLSAEAATKLYNGKVVRLSRCVSAEDGDIEEIIKTDVDIPTFIKRSYCHLDFIALALVDYATRVHEMPDILHLAGRDTVSYYDFAKMLNPNTRKRRHEKEGCSPRPFRCGLNTNLASRLGFYIPPIEDTVRSIIREL